MVDDDEAPLIYGVEFQARALCAVSGVPDDDTVRFLVGTQSIKFENQVHFLEYEEEAGLLNKSIYSHRAGEIWRMASSPTDHRRFATIYQNIQDSNIVSKCTVWQIPFDSNTEEGNSPTIDASTNQLHQPLRKRFDLNVPNTNIIDVEWETNGEHIASISETNIYIWNVEQPDTPSISSTGAIDSKSSAIHKLSCCRWNPHMSTNQLATALGPHVRGWDLRSMKPSFSIDNAHSPCVRDIDYNPNRQYHLMTCGDDCRVKFWDVRKTNECLKILTDHSHWVWSARYNRFHDQLIVTSSSDTRVILFNIASLSSEPYGSLNTSEDVKEEAEELVNEDRLICVFDEHEESVYSAQWASNDPWLLASLSYDGRLILNRVPKNEKFQILLRCPT
ncbi:unnamed protein product [Adineta ricciae]|uniref:EIPR1-like beta-propeller domain-containing protein n=1 Tax=Adineta ricciae TaxID=249248 RepID=A0A814IAJ0_ADIRI|nr:unnamed protein product [Adineta ricciae]